MSKNDPYADDVGAVARDPYADDVPQGRLRAALTANGDQDQQGLARARQIAREMSVPVEVVKAIPDEMAREARINRVDAATVAAPTLRKHFTDADFATLAEPEAPLLAKIENGIKGTARYVMGADGSGGLPGFAKRGVQFGYYGSRAAVAGVSMALTETVGNFVPNFGDGPDLLGALSKNSAEVAAYNFKKAMEVQFGGGDVIGQSAESAIASFVSQIKYMPLLAFGPAGATAALAGMGLETFGKTYAEYRAKGNAPTASLVQAVPDGVVEVATEVAPMFNLAVDVARGTPFLKAWAQQILPEIKGEEAATAVQEFNEWVRDNDPNKTFMDYLKERPRAALVTALATIMGVGANIATSKGLDKIIDKVAEGQMQREWDDTIKQHDALQELIKQAAGSKVRELDPETFRNYVQAAADNTEGAPKSAFVDGRVLGEVLQQAGITPDVLAQTMPSIASQLEAAHQSNSPVEIPLGELATALPGTPLEEALLPHLRMDGPESLSQAEAVSARDGAKELLAKKFSDVVQQAQDSARMAQGAKMVQDAMHTQLMATGRMSEDVAARNSALVRDYYTVMAGYLNTTPDALWIKQQQYNVANKGRETGVLTDTGKAGALTVEGYHYSTQARPIISGHAYGSGLKGSNAELYTTAADKRLRNRSYFYVDTGNGITPEAGVGGIGHRVNLSNIYDANSDPLRLRKGGQLAFESAVLDRGYDGYLDRLSGTQPGQVVVLGDKQINAEVLGPLGKTTGKKAPPMVERPSRGRDMVVDRVSANKTLPAGSPSLERWGEILKAQMPDDYAAMQDAGVFEGDLAKPMYKSELVKLFESKTENPVYEQKAPTSNIALPKKGTLTTAVDIRKGGRLTGDQAMDIHQVGAYFDKLAKGPHDFNDPKAQARAMKTMMAELEYQMSLEKSGLDWYEEDIANAFAVTQQYIPELADPAQRQLFAVIAGLQSPGTNARDNWKIAAEAFQHYKKTGVIPGRNPANGQLWAGGPVSANKEKALTFLNNMVQDMGEQKAIEWLMGTHSVKDLNAARAQWGNMGPGVTGKATDTAMGVVAFGPKVGPFVMNINGIHEITVDVWATRTFNRYFGKMVGPDGKITDAPTEPERRVVKELVNAAAEKSGIKPYQVQSVLWFFEQQLFNHLGTGTPSYGFSDGARRFADNAGDVAGLRQPVGNAQAPTGVGEVYAQGTGTGWDSPRGFAPLPGAPKIEGASGPDPRLIAVAEQYAASLGIPLKRQSDYVKVDPVRAAALAAEYDAMEHAPQDPAVKEAYANLIQQTLAQYRALEAAGYKFYFFDETNDPYQGNPWNAMRDLRANQRMGVFATESGFGSGATELNVDDNPLLADTGVQWPYGSERGTTMKRVLANDLFRAVHDAFGHGLEGAGFRAEGEENAWQAHVRLFTGSAVAAITSETRGQNSWLNYGPFGEANRNAKVEDTVFADQKTGLMPAWTWGEGRAGDAMDSDGKVIGKLESNIYAQGARATLDDFSPEAIGDILKKNDWSILTAENPMGEQATPEENATKMVALKADLDAMGAQYVEAVGKYGQVENSLVVTGITQEEAVALGAKYEQDSVLTKRGLVYPRTGDVTPVTGKVDVFADAPEDFYTTIPSTGAKFAIELDWREGAADYSIRKTDTGFEALDVDGKRIGKLNSNITPEQSKQLNESASVDHIGVDKERQKQGIGSALYAAWSDAHEGRIAPSGKTSADAWRRWKADYPEKVAEFVQQEATRLAGGAPAEQVLGNITDPEIKQAVVDAKVDKYQAKYLAGRDPNKLNQEERAQYDALGGKLAQPAEKEVIRGTFDVETMTTVLNPEANLSTFLHETGHFFLEMTMQLAAGPDAPLQIVKMSQDLLKSFGIKDLDTWHAMTVNQKRKHHERFAETFELYLLEGKAPSVEQQSAFRVFSSWLKRVYQSAKAFAEGKGITLDPDLTSVMDRMLATEEQIAEAEKVAGLIPNFDATSEANEKLNARSIRDLKWAVNARNKFIKAMQMEAKDTRRNVKAEVTAEVNEMREFKAKEQLASLRKENGGQLDTLKLTTMAEGFRFKSVDDMLTSIDAAGNKADVIEGMTDQRMLERHGDLSDQAAIEQAATEAVHNQARAKALATELTAQQEMLNTREDTGKTNAAGRKITVNAMVAAAKQFAQNVIGKRKVSDLKKAAWAHTQAERRAGQAWQDATKKGDTKAAVQAKQDQLLNNAAVREAQDAMRQVQETLAFFATVMKGNNETVVEKGRDPDVVNAARVILAAYGYAPFKGKAAAEYLDLVKKNNPDVFSVIEEGVRNAITSAKPMKDLTTDELIALRDEVASLWHLAKSSRHYEVAGKAMDIDDISERIQERLVEKGIPDVMPGDLHAPTPADIASTKLQFAGALLARVEAWSQIMDGKFGGPFLRFIFQPVKDAANKYNNDSIVYRKKYQALVEKLAPALKQGEIAAPELGGYVFGKAATNLLNDNGSADHPNLGAAELTAALLHLGNPSNKRKLLLGRGWATEVDGVMDTSRWDAFMERMHREGTINKAHYDFAQGVWDLLESMKPLAQDAHRDAFGRYFSEVTAESFEVPDIGFYRGGYVPAQVDTRQVKDNEVRHLAELENQSMVYSFPSVSKGFTISRTEYNRPLMLNLNTLTQHMDKVLLFSHMTGPVRGVNRVLTSKGVSFNLNRVAPAALSGLLTPWLKRSASQQVETPTLGDGGMAKLATVARSRAGLSLMLANISNTAQQITGALLATVKVKPSHLARAMAEYTKSPQQMAQSVSKASPYMAHRMENEISAINAAMEDILLNPSTYKRAQTWTSRHAYFMQSALDNVMSTIVWTGAFNQGIEQGMTQPDAIQFADGTVRQTQGANAAEDISRIEAGPAYVRVFTQFYSYFSMMANTNAMAVANLVDEFGLKKGMAKAVPVVLMGYMASAWVAEAISQAFKGGPGDDDKDGYLDDWLRAVFVNGSVKSVLAAVPFVGQLAGTMFNTWNSKPYDDKTSVSPAISMLDNAGRAPHSVYVAIAKNGSVQAAVRDVGTAIGMMTGLPTAALARPAGYLAGVAANEIQPTGPGDFVRGMLTGVASPESKR